MTDSVMKDYVALAGWLKKLVGKEFGEIYTFDFGFGFA